MADYDIGKAFESIENEIMSSMVRNMKRHRAEETAYGFNWSMWQAEELKTLERFKKHNAKRFSKQFESINGSVEELLRQARAEGNMSQETKILNAIKKGFKVPGRNITESARTVSQAGEFFKLNDRKLNALIKATQDDFKRAETAMLRMANDQYRKIIFNAQVYANTGAGTYEKAVDMAIKDFASRGINCIEYKNGARHTIAEYADMAIRTASKRAYLTGEGEKRQEWGIHTVIMNKRGNACPLCLPFVGKVLIDDVWSGGSQKDGPYMLMSSAMEAGLYHPRCKDTHTTYFPGISSEGASYTREELAKVEEDYKAEQRRQNVVRQAARFGRLAELSLDPDNQRMYSGKENMLRAGGREGSVQTITTGVISKVPIIATDEMDEEIAEFMSKEHKRLLDTAMIENNSFEVGRLFDESMQEIGTVFGDKTGIDLNIPGRSKAKYVIHNHPNNSSFSNQDIIWLINNESTKYFSIVKNNGGVEILEKSNHFDRDMFILEYKRLVKKNQKIIASNEQLGYDKVIEQLLNKTKSGLLYVR